MLHEAFGASYTEDEDNIEADETYCNEPMAEAEKFYKLMGDLELKLYPNCKAFSKLSFVIKLFHIKCLGGVSDKAISMLLQLFKQALPEGNTLPDSFYEANKIIQDLSLPSRKIDACPNDCMLFWKENANDEECKKCHASRWKVREKVKDAPSSSNAKQTKIPCKVMRYFPLIPRLQRLYMSTKTASSMRWHHNRRVNDGLMRHPADSRAWNSFDELYPSFASDSRNVRLGLASDGFSPFKTCHIPHSTWSVVLIPYNLPPWMCMKQYSLFISMLIPGPKGPKEKIDVYLQPLIEELKLLWEVGVVTYDAFVKKNFSLLFWYGQSVTTLD